MQKKVGRKELVWKISLLTFREQWEQTMLAVQLL